MKKLLILVMLVSVGLAGITSADLGKMNYYRWNNGDTTTDVKQYQRDFSTPPHVAFTVDSIFRFPISDTVSTNALETPTWANGDNYAARFDGWIVPSETANYTFRITADDYAELWLSTDENSANAVKISSVNGWTNQRDWADGDISPSSAIPLTAGKGYFFYAVWKEGGGGDGCAVGWINDASITATTVVPLRNVSNTYPIGKVLPNPTYSVSRAVEYDLWDPPADGDVSVYGVVGGFMPDFATMPAPTSKGLLDTFGTGPATGTDDFIFRQYAIIKLDVAETVTFGTTSDDGSKLYVGNWWTNGPLTLVVDNDGWHGGQWYYNSIALPAGYVGVVVEMFEDGGGEGLTAGFCSATIPWNTFPSSRIYSRRYASRPSPANNAVVPTDAVLSWSKPVANEGTTNILYVGENGATLTEVYRGTDSSYAYPLNPNMGYEWRVDVEEPNAAHPETPDILTGQVWGFTTQAVAVEKKMIAYWPLDADLADSTGNLLPGKYNSNDSSAPVFVPGIKGNALAINIADTTQAQYVQLADKYVAGLSATGISGNLPRTIVCWAKSANVPVGTAANWCNIFGFTSLSGANGYVFDFNKFSGNEQYCITRYGGDWFMANIDANWHFLVATYEPYANNYQGAIRYYADGKLVGTQSNYSMWTQDRVHIGKRAHSTPLWPGYVDEARIYNYALTPQEVAELYADAVEGLEVCLGTTYPAYDFNKNCVVDTADLLLFAADWLNDFMVE